MAKKNKKKKSAFAKICSITGTGMILIVIALCSLLVLPGIFGYYMYHVLSGSMEPQMPVGSLIYVHKEAPEEIGEQDIIAFFSSLEDSGIITHRVIKNNIASGTFITKGDANEKEDTMPVPYDNFIGRVVLIIPYVGKALTALTSFYGKIAAACIVALGVILNLAGSRQETED